MNKCCDEEINATVCEGFLLKGKNGQDGFSPTITVEEDNEESYKLKVTDANGSFVTPNLKATSPEIGDVLNGEITILGAPQSPILTLGTEDDRVSLSLSTEPRDGAKFGLVLGDRNNGMALTYFDAPLLYESGARVYSPNNPPPFRLSVEGQVQQEKLREKDYILIEVKNG